MSWNKNDNNQQVRARQTNRIGCSQERNSRWRCSCLHLNNLKKPSFNAPTSRLPTFTIPKPQTKLVNDLFFFVHEKFKRQMDSRQYHVPVLLKAEFWLTLILSHCSYLRRVRALTKLYGYV